MKKLIVVSKTHLDLGFTDYAENIKQKYIKEYIPNAIRTANELNINGEKNFIWTTGSWILNEALKLSNKENKEKLVAALKDGNIAPHAMPFTTHTELLDYDSLDYGLSIADEIDAISGRKTIAAKMTDVPGHTKAIVPLLQKHGIKLLHIGVNGASALPEVPPCFLWKCGDSEVIVIYSGDYGGKFECVFTDDILYFDHTLDNHGAAGNSAITKKIAELKKQYPDYTVMAGRLDDYAEILWKQKDKLPVIESEIGDSWIHGSASDPYKSAALRTLIAFKNKWIEEKSLSRSDASYKTLTENILCLAEHTCGMDMKSYLGDYEHYLKPDFRKAYFKDNVKIKRPLRDFPQNFLITVGRRFGSYHPCSYSAVEKSWQEQRNYIDSAIKDLPDNLKAEINAELKKLISENVVKSVGEKLETGKTYDFSDCSLSVNKYGGIGALSLCGEKVITENDNPCFQYHSYGKKDYDFWLNNYTRNLSSTKNWAVGDFARPLLRYIDNKYPQGVYPYSISSGTVDGNRIIVNLSVEKELSEILGAPRTVQIVYTVNKDSLTAELYWLHKDASRLTESITFRIFPDIDKNSIVYSKLGSDINPYDVVRNGNRNISAVEKVKFTVNSMPYEIINYHSPLVSLGNEDILKFDNSYKSVEKDGLSFILYDNIWGTNFPLWYKDNAYFKFEIKPSKK